MTKMFFRFEQFRVEMMQISTTDILQFATFEQIPDTFLWVEFGGVSWQTLQVQALGCTFCQKVFDRLCSMNGRSIPRFP